MMDIKQEIPSVDSGAVTTPKAEPTDGNDDVKPSPMDTSQTSTTPVQSPAPQKPRARKSMIVLCQFDSYYSSWN
jgi:hypothetical protein